MNPLDYRTLSDLFRMQQSQGTTSAPDLKSFSQQLGETTGHPELFQQGVQDSVVKRLSTGLDRGIEATGIPDVTAALGRAALEPFGYGSVGQSVGQSLPRTAVNFLPLAAAELLSGGAATPLVAGAVGTAGAGLLSGADTYTKTGSATAGLVSAATQGAFANFGGGSLVSKLADYGLGKIGGELAQNGAVKYLAHQAAGIGVQEASGEAENVAEGKGLYNPLTPEHIAGTAAGVLPFAVTDLLRMAGSIGRPTTTDRVIDAQEAPEQATEPTVVPTEKPEQVDPVAAFKNDSDIDKALTLFGQQLSTEPPVPKDPSVLPTGQYDIDGKPTDLDGWRVSGEPDLAGQVPLEDVGGKNKLTTSDPKVLDMLKSGQIKSIAQQNTERLVPIEVADQPVETFEDAATKVANAGQLLKESAGPIPTDESLSQNMEQEVKATPNVDQAATNVTQRVANDAVDHSQVAEVARKRRGAPAMQQEEINSLIGGLSDDIPEDVQIKSIVDKALKNAPTNDDGTYARNVQQTVASWLKGRTIGTTGRVIAPREGGLTKLQSRIGYKTRGVNSAPRTQEVVASGSDRAALEAQAMELNADLKPDSNITHTVTKQGDQYRLLRETKTINTGSAGLENVDETTIKQPLLPDTATMYEPKPITPEERQAASGVASQMVTGAKNLPDSFFEDDLPGRLGPDFDEDNIPRTDVLRNRVAALMSVFADGQEAKAENVNKYLTKFHQFGSDGAVQQFIRGDVFTSVRDHLLDVVNGTVDTPQARVFGSGGERGTSGGVNQPDVSNQGLFGTQTLLNQYFKDLPPLQRQSSVETALKITSALRQNETRLGELVNDTQGVYHAGLAMLDGQGRSGTYLANMLRDQKVDQANAGDMMNYVLAHEHVHHVLELPDAALPPELAQARSDLNDLLVNATPEEHLALIEALRGSGLTVDSITRQGANNPDRNVAATETMANIGASLAMKMVEGDRGWLNDVVSYLPKPVGDFLLRAFEWVQKMARSVFGVAHLAENGFSDGQFGKNLVDSGKQFASGLEQFARTRDQIDSDINKFMQMQNFDPVGFGVLQQASKTNPLFTSGIEFDGPKWAKLAQKDVSDSFGLEKEKGPLSWMGDLYKKYLLQPSVLAVNAPYTKNEIGAPLNARAELNLRDRELNSMLGMDIDPNGNFVQSDTARERNVAIMQNPKTRQFFDDILRRQNEGTQDGNPEFPQEEFNKLLSASNLSDAQKKATFQVANIFWNMTRRIQDFAVETETKRGSNNIATIVQSRNPDNKVEVSKQVADLLQQGVEMIRTPETQAVGEQLLDSARGMIDSDTFNQAYQYAVDDNDRINSLKESYAGVPRFASEQREGRFYITYKDINGKSGSVGAETRQKAIEAAKSLADKGNVQINIADKATQSGGFSAPDGVLETLERLESERMEKLAPYLSQEQLEDYKSQPTISQAYREEQAARSRYKFGSNRRLAPGREYLPMLENQFKYLQSTLHALGKAQIRSDISLGVMDPAYRDGNPLNKQLVLQHRDNMFTPDTDLGRTLGKINFHYFMGASPSTAIQQSFHVVMSHLPYLVHEGAGLIEANKLILQSAKNIGESAISGKWANPEHEALMRANADEVGIKGSGVEDLFDDETGALLHVAQQTKGQDISSLQQTVQKPLALLGAASKVFFNASATFNNRMALLASYDYYRSKGDSVFDAQQKATDFNRTANFVGGKLNRPIGLFSSRGNIAQTASQALYALQSFNFGMTGMMGTYIKQSLTGNVQARKALATMVGTQLLCAGALGFPGVGIAIAGLEKAFPTLELHKAIVQNVQNLTDQDDQLGNVFSDVALHGVLNQLGIDLSSRVAFGHSFLGTNAYDGFDASAAAGPELNLIKNLVVGTQQVSQGNVLQGLQTAAPAAVRRLLNLYTSDGTVRANNGQMLLQPSLGQQFAMAIGFRPAALANLREAQQIQQRAQQVQRLETGNVTGQSVEAIQQGDYSRAQQLLSQYGVIDPTFNPQEAARTIAQQVVERNNPVDVRLTNSNATGTAIGLAGTSSLSMVNRLQQQKQIESGLGLPGTISPGEYARAFSIDQQLQSHPEQSVQQARQAIAPPKFQNPFLFGAN